MEDPGDRPNRAYVRWLYPALVVVAALAVVSFVLLPRFTEDDPLESVGEEGSAARAIATMFEGQMTCTAGELDESRSVLACYQQTDQQVAIVFVQADRNGRVASYTVETQPLADTPDTGQVIAVANQVAAVVTPGEDFADCSYTHETPFFCFGSLASWESTDLPPVESTGTKKNLPDVDKLGEGLNALGWECDFGICIHDGTTMTVVESATGLGLQFNAPVDAAHVREAANELLAEIGDDTEELQEWTAAIDGTLDIIVADGLVIGYLPQIGEAGMLVVDEVAGVLPGTA
ncbi:hypothetical protein [Cumulibacter soli]|uniref:hypothetical protein n=1 Tax=Cumulibacter soli TaxID=2546344 RepID=UPI001067628F|nr:hypothetical protein [Cumulibacter soli]